ncbi:MAG: hypothetical protein MMC23_010148 [Stictis urceolatum]|nr:hypothetical protein [Stictis urceolata]
MTSVDYSLYLVTDSSEALLQGRDLPLIVKQAIDGGVTIVQFRDKSSETKDLILQASKLHAVTRSCGIPLIINDRVDVALAIGAEGVHLGQDDMDLATARSLLGQNTVIGVTCHSVEEAHTAVLGGADYIGIGTIFATPTKKDATNIIGIPGCRNILDYLSTTVPRFKIATVAIGGINASNIQRVLYLCTTPLKTLDGVAVVSALVGSHDPSIAAKHLRNLARKPYPSRAVSQSEAACQDVHEILQVIPRITKRLADTGPLCHNMTNLVVQNLAANVVMSIRGAKPIMANDGSEAEDLSSLGGSLVVNIGTVNRNSLSDYLSAVQAYNGRGNPVLLDPVGAGATQLRRQAVQTLLAGGYFDVIKGNENEIEVLLRGSQQQQHGVDSSRELGIMDKARLVKRLAQRERNIAIMTGEVDLTSDGDRIFLIRNGDPYLGMITGAGCTLGATIAAYISIQKQDKLIGALAGMLHFEVAAEMARREERVQGPGTFVPVFIDCLSKIAQYAQEGNNDWLKAADIELLDV